MPPTTDLLFHDGGRGRGRSRWRVVQEIRPSRSPVVTLRVLPTGSENHTKQPGRRRGSLKAVSGEFPAVVLGNQSLSSLPTVPPRHAPAAGCAPPSDPRHGHLLRVKQSPDCTWTAGKKQLTCGLWYQSRKMGLEACAREGESSPSGAEPNPGGPCLPLSCHPFSHRSEHPPEEMWLAWRHRAAQPGPYLSGSFSLQPHPPPNCGGAPTRLPWLLSVPHFKGIVLVASGLHRWWRTASIIHIVLLYVKCHFSSPARLQDFPTSFEFSAVCPPCAQVSFSSYLLGICWIS